MQESKRNQIVRMWYQRTPERRIAKALGISRRTVSRILSAHKKSRGDGASDEPAGKPKRPGFLDPYKDRIAALLMDQTCFELTMQRSRDGATRGHKPGPETSFFKLYGTELNQRRQELFTALAGQAALGWAGDGYDADDLGVTRDWLRSRGNTIEGGTSEVQLNIIAKRVLDLPD